MIDSRSAEPDFPQEPIELTDAEIEAESLWETAETGRTAGTWKPAGSRECICSSPEEEDGDER